MLSDPMAGQLGPQESRTGAATGGGMTSSVSGNDVDCSCFRIFTLSCCAWSVLVRWRPPPWAAIVTQLVTQAAFLSGIIRRRGQPA